MVTAAMPRSSSRSPLDQLHKRLRQPDVPEAMRVLAKALFSAAQADDLGRLDADDLLWITRVAHELLLCRTPGRARVRTTDPDIPSVELSRVSVLQTLSDNMPFLVDSLLGYLAEEGLEIRLLLHPVLHVQRDSDGRLRKLALAPEKNGGYRAESLIHIHLPRLSEEEKERLRADVEGIFAHVRAAVLDWPAMRQKVADLIDGYQTAPPPMPVEELTEVIAFLQWLLADNFVFLGARDFVMQDGTLVPREGGLGILRLAAGGEKEQRAERAVEMADGIICRPEARREPLLITKSAETSCVHRRVPMDLVIAKRFDAAGNPVGELRILGLFASPAYVRAARDIPLLRRKISEVMRRSGLDPENHLGKVLLNILETFPRDELFELDVDTLSEIALGILRLEERPRPRVFVWRGCSARFASAFAFIPRDRFNSQIRERVGEVLETALSARVIGFRPQFPDGVMVRVHFRLELLDPSLDLGAIDLAALDARVAEVVRTWEDRLEEVMRSRWGEERAERLLPLYRGAFSQAYQEAFDPATSLHDIEVIESLKEGRDVAVSLYRAIGDGADVVRLKLYHFDTAVPLSVRVPILSNAGFAAVEERTFTICRGQHHDQAREIYIHEMLLRTSDGEPLDLPTLRPLLEEGFLAIWNGLAENDAFNALMPVAGFTWRQVSVLRALAAWMRQGGAPYSSGYVAMTLRRHPQLARTLWRIFETLFRPGRAGVKTRRRQARQLRQEVLKALAEVQSLDEDRIFRMYLAALFAMRRTNFWQERQVDGMPAPLAFKFAAQEVDFLPEPRPWAEIYVHAPDVAGVHLRGGPIARGGIRWSDRLQDFRTEILGLVKAQTVKNAVIVPVGAKGGFVVRGSAAGMDREAWLAAGRRAYRRFISVLLDITDNIVNNEVVPPRRVVRHDGDDPYLVVAADKGTATFSDLANEIAAEHEFWLDDAFASGGSAGYDHKKMGITARGAWEAVKRHFREMDVDIERQSISVIGIGDMSGDVFGNGMLLSKKIRLIAAFDHRDIFIDPDPDPAVAWRERRRLFEMPRSSWQDYDRARISRGGGVFSRRAKSIRLTDEMRRVLATDARELTPDELIRAVLKAPADLLWLGGIGTYVRATSERDSDVGDPANDHLRITAPELRVKVVGEGANLGLTQKARIEYALLGGRVNMDAIDNSAGVNTSDVEVNMKIAMRAAELAGRLQREERNRLLAGMEEDVAALVLRNNYLQTLCISLSVARGERETGDLVRLMQSLERRGALDRRLEDLPDEATIAERAARGQGFTRPEIAVLMSFAKIVLFDDLLACGIVDDPWHERTLFAYFPEPMQARFAGEIRSHRLRREIIANRLGNAMINHGGPAFVSRLQEQTGRGIAEIAAAFTLAENTLRLPEVRARIDRLDGRIEGERQLSFYLVVQRTLRHAAGWYLRNEDLPGNLGELIESYARDLSRFEGMLRDVATPHARMRLRVRREEFAAAGAPDALARRLARLPYLLRGLDIIAVSRAAGAVLEDAARVYFLAGHELRISPLMMAARRLPASDHHERLAAAQLAERLSSIHRELSAAMLRLAPGEEGLRQWRVRHDRPVERALRMLDDIMAGASMTLARLALAVSVLDELAEVTRRTCPESSEDASSSSSAAG
jgi:glutamate dehydrogenase